MLARQRWRRVGRRTIAGATTLLVVAAAACSSGSGEASVGCDEAAPVATGQLRVVTTVAPITSIVSVIASGTEVRVDGIVPEGVDSHTFEPTTRVASALEQADVVFLNGLGLELPTKELALANADDAVICELGDQVLDERDHIYDFTFPESAGSPNPHLWTNPRHALAYAEVVRDVLAAVDPEGVDVYTANLEGFAARVGELDRAIRTASESLAPEERVLLTYHDAYAYFARDYGWEIVGAVQPSSFREPTPSDVAALVAQVRERGVPVIFGSAVYPSPVLRQIADETGVEYVDDLRDDDLPGEPDDDEHSWLGLMRFNVVTMIEALGGDAGAVAVIDVSPVGPDLAVYASG